MRHHVIFQKESMNPADAPVFLESSKPADPGDSGRFIQHHTVFDSFHRYGNRLWQPVDTVRQSNAMQTV